MLTQPDIGPFNKFIYFPLCFMFDPEKQSGSSEKLEEKDNCCILVHLTHMPRR